MTTSEACDLLVIMTCQCFAARAERDELQLWLRVALRVLITQCREIDRLRAVARREREEHHALRQAILERTETV